MISLKIEKNDANQRLDRFLRKYFPAAPLGMIYRMIRKDVKVNGRRQHENSVLSEGDEIVIYIDGEKANAMRAAAKESAGGRKVKRSFKVAYEDQDILIADKPFGLLTHGDAHEKKNTLTNQVLAYLTERGEYDLGREKTFTPAPANRLDRNTTGLVIFGKNADALRRINAMLRTHDGIEKFYVTIVKGEMPSGMTFSGSLSKDEDKNRVSVGEGRASETIVRPVATKNGFSYVEAELVTGRTHQIRAHLAAAGFPLIGDDKYGDRELNKRFKSEFGLAAQILHAARLQMPEGPGTVISPLPKRFRAIKDALFGEENNSAR